MPPPTSPSSTHDSAHPISRIKILAQCVLVLLVTFGAVAAYLSHEAHRARQMQYSEFQFAVDAALELWASGRVTAFKNELQPLLDDAEACDLFAARKMSDLGARLSERLAGTFARGDATSIRLRDSQNRVLLVLTAAGQLIPSGEDLERGGGEPKSLASDIRLTALGEARLRIAVPWYLGNGQTAYVEMIDDSSNIQHTLAPYLRASLYALPDALAAPISSENLPPAILDEFRDRSRAAPGQIARLLQPLVADGSPGETGIVHGHSMDAIAVPARAEGAVTHNALVALRNVDMRELMLRKSIAIAVLLAIVLSVLIAFYAVRTSIQLLGSLPNEDAKRLREREERLRAIMDAVADGIIASDRDGLILSVNPAVEAIFGYSSAELVGKPVRTLTPDNSDDVVIALQRQIEELGESSRGVKGELMGRRKDGTLVPVELSVSRGIVDGAEVATVVVRDVTESKAAKDLLIETVREQKTVQQALRHRSNELVRAARQLTQARDKAEAANAAKSRFLATMSHELRTPMNGILGMIGLLIQSPLRPDQKAWAETIKESGDALLTLLNDILDLSKIEAGKLEVHPTTLDPVVLARHMATTWGPLAEAKGLAFHLYAPPEGRFVMGDAVRLRQILSNFVNNAIKFTDRGEVRLAVKLEALNAGQAKLRYEISDTGIGIAKDKLGLLFQKFTQVDGSLARRHGGSGLGLAICRELAALMGGEVGVNTVEGAGSLFWLEVPCAIVAGQDWAQSEASMLSSTRQATEETAVNERLKILVAEDHPVNQSLFRALIDHLGHDLDVVNDGAEAVAALQTRPYDLVLLDAHMPVMDGIEAAAQIRALGGAAAKTPLIVVTADAMAGDRERYLAAGMDDYITKPVDMRELAAAIARHSPRNRDNAAAPRLKGAA